MVDAVVVNAEELVRDLFVFGGSAGGIEALLGILRRLPPDLPATIGVALHRSPLHRSPAFASQLAAVLGRIVPLPVSASAGGSRATRRCIACARRSIRCSRRRLGRAGPALPASALRRRCRRRRRADRDHGQGRIVDRAATGRGSAAVDAAHRHSQGRCRGCAPDRGDCRDASALGSRPSLHASSALKPRATRVLLSSAGAQSPVGSDAGARGYGRRPCATGPPDRSCSRAASDLARAVAASADRCRTSRRRVDLCRAETSVSPCREDSGGRFQRRFGKYPKACVRFTGRGDCDIAPRR